MSERIDRITGNILSHRPDPAYMEDLWEEIDSAIGEPGGLDLTLGQLIQRAAEKRATCGEPQ